jgi:nucleotidyltransferase/DNA polymerase involved in DNA repair
LRRRGGCHLRGQEVRRPLRHGFDDGATPMPDLIFVPPRFDVYREISQQIRTIFAEYTPFI